MIVDAGYDSVEQTGFDGNSCGISVSIGSQSPEIAHGVDKSLEARSGSADKYASQGAGDQGMMFGYATNETPQLMPAAITLAHAITALLDDLRKSGRDQGMLRPDGKSQATIAYDKHGKPKRLDTLVVSAQHRADVSQQDLQAMLQTELLPAIVKANFDPELVRLLINPSGSFILGGPSADAGLTGRKIIVDTYGGAARHGGGAFSGKDPSKVDRSAAYAMRWVAKNIVAANLADRCEVQVAYAIGKADPVGLYVNTFGTGIISDKKLGQLIKSVFDLRPAALIYDLDLLHTRYRPTATYGHFGHDDYPWEQTNAVEHLLDAFSRIKNAFDES